MNREEELTSKIGGGGEEERNGKKLIRIRYSREGYFSLLMIFEGTLSKSCAVAWGEEC